jgi:hypothetical protein
MFSAEVWVLRATFVGVADGKFLDPTESFRIATPKLLAVALVGSDLTLRVRAASGWVTEFLRRAAMTRLPSALLAPFQRALVAAKRTFLARRKDAAAPWIAKRSVSTLLDSDEVSEIARATFEDLAATAAVILLARSGEAALGIDAAKGARGTDLTSFPNAVGRALFD